MERCGHGFDGIRFSASVLRFPGCRLVFPRIEDLRRQWHRGDAQSPFRTWKLSPVAAMVLRSEGRGRVARCRITRHGGGCWTRVNGSDTPLFVLLVLVPNPPKKQKHMSLETAVPRPACRAFAVKARTGSVRITRGEAVQDFWKTMPSRWLLTEQSLRDSGSRRGANPILPD